ncbi:ESF1 homolog [Toxorhynchites rutilus septentrionalis]|uniref:ESF1 homolog n=1 Tax=Toxorhynchites rutilus septentrionalis TaxID=329112 RepID=UPI00247A87EC|nr:ESF1 homolog [Toxorhynchites rutilus septentrionalis]
MAKHKKDGRSSTNGASNAVAKQSKGSATSQIWSDDRFAHLVNDPRFKGIPRAEKKVKIDKRFRSMFSDERFNVKQTVDKYGRKIKQGDSEELRKYYDVESSAEEDEDAELEKAKESDEEPDTEQQPSGSESDLDGPELNDEEKAMSMSGDVKSRLKDLEVDYARGEGTIMSDSSSDDDSDDGEQSGDEVFIEHVWGELDGDAERTDETTRRLALCNVDWDRIRAVDIMAMLSSFLPRGATILSVTIYPSEFGKQRMKEEEQSGPQELTGQNPVDSDDSDDDEMDEDEKKQRQVERLREYQLNRLKYYYAVIVCDSIETADKLYKECDGVEYESTANKIDLRFVPDDMDFDDEPKEKCTELPEGGKYEPRIFTTTALNQASVELTWDENDVERKEFNEKIRAGKLTEVSDADLKKYVACSSSEEEEDETDQNEDAPEVAESEDESKAKTKSKKTRKQDMIAKYKALLGDIKEQDEKERNEKVEMEFTWKVNEDGSQAKQSDQDSESEAEKKKRDNVNPFEKILEKAKEKKKRRKELKKKKKRGVLNSDGDPNEDSSDDDLPYGVDLNDPFFASAFDEKEFDLKKPNKKDKKKKKDKDADNEEDEEEAARKRAELELMLDDGEDDKSHFNLKKIQEDEIDLKAVSKSKRKRILKKSKKQIEEQRHKKTATDDFQIDLEDDRFKAIYERADYNLDPTSSSFKKTKAMEQLIEAKLKKRPLHESDIPGEDGVAQAKKTKKDVTTSLLVKSIKRKIGK